ncbi:MAG: PH domain-containing protein [Candidatus Paceibacterota bacterium]|jgi:hypothetical protein
MFLNGRIIWEGRPDFMSWFLMHLTVIIFMGLFFVVAPLVMMVSSSQVVGNQFMHFTGIDVASYLGRSPRSAVSNVAAFVEVIPLILFFLLPGLLFVLNSIAQIFLGWVNTYYIFTDRDIRVQYGIINKKSIVVPLENIESIGSTTVLSDSINKVFGGNTSTVAIKIKGGYIPPLISFIKFFGLDINMPMSLYSVPNAAGIIKDMGLSLNNEDSFWPEPAVLDEEEDKIDN